MSTSLRRPAVALLATSLAATVLGVAPAHAVDSTLSGTVTASDSGDGLPQVTVELFQYDDVDQYWAPVDDAYTYTDGSGAYSFTVPQGQYRVGFSDSYSGYIPEYYADVADVDDATTVDTTTGAQVVDVELDPGAHVTGTVTGPGGTGLGGIRVGIYAPVDDGGYTYNDQVGSTFTLSDGSYDVGGLATGDYLVELSDPSYGFDDTTTWATEWYDDVTTDVEAAPVSVTAPATTSGIDAELGADAQFSGTITDATGAGVQGFVQAYTKVGTEWEYVANAYAETDGTYVLEGLRPGTYRVEFYGWVDGQFASEFWQDKGRITNASDVVVTAATPVQGIDAVLVPNEHDGDYAVKNLTAPVVSGTPQVGSPLTATAGTWSPDPSLIEFYWVSGDDVLQSGTSSTYVPTAADLGKSITLYVYASADGWDYGYAEVVVPGTVAAAPAPPVVTPPVVTPPVVTPPVVDAPTALAAIVQGLDVTGKPKVGSTLKISGLDKLFRASTAVSYTFQWYAGSKKIKKATKSKLKVVSSLKGTKLSVKVTASAAASKKTVKLKVGKVR